MSVNVTFNGVVYIIPETGEVGWGGNTTTYLVAVAAGALQKTGGSFTLSAETDFGASFGLKSLYYKSRTVNPASTGIVRLANDTDHVVWRNQANSADLTLYVDVNNRLLFNGNPVLTGTLPSAYVSSITGTANQVIASASTGAVTLSLPQSIATSSSPTFTNLTLSALTASSFSYVDAAKAVSSTAAPLNGEILIGSTGVVPVKSTLTGTSNQVIVSNGAGSITLSTPQAIATSSAVQFGTLGLGSSIVASSILSLTSTTLGFLPPRMTTGQRDAIASPATGLFIYNTTTGVNNYYTGAVWAAIAAGGTINTGAAGFFSYYPANGTTLDDQPTLYTDGSSIGIGTTTPDQTLDVVHSVGAYFHNNKTNNTVKSSRLGSLSYANVAYFPLTWGTSTGAPGTNDATISIGGGTASGYAANIISFRTAANDTTVTGTEWAKVNTSGQFLFSGTTPTLPGISFISDPNTGVYNPLADNLAISTNGTLALLIDSSQNTIIPATKGLYLDGGFNTYISESSSDKIEFFTGGTARVSIDTTTLFTNLNLTSQRSASGANVDFTVDNTSNTASSNARGIFQVGGTSANDPTIQFAVPGGSPGTWSVGVDNSDSDKFKINNSSTLGVGSTLEINASNQILALNGTASLPSWTFSDDPNTGSYSVSADVLGFATGGTLRMRLDSSGYLGIGAAPNFPLTVIRSVSDTTNRIVVSNTNGTTLTERRSFVSAIGDNLSHEISLVAGRDSANVAYEMLDGTTFIQFGTGGTERARMTSTGAFNVGFGTSALPGYSFSGDEDTGVCRPGANNLVIVTNGTAAIDIGNTQVSIESGHQFVIPATQKLLLDGSGVGDSYIRESSANTIEIVTGGTQTGFFNANGCAIKGTNTNDSAGAGYNGEYIESVVSNVTVPATGTFGDAASISLTAGDWDVTFIGLFANNGGTSTANQIGVSQTSGNSTTGLTIGSNRIDAPIPTSAINGTATIASYRQSLSATTTIYGKFRADYTSTAPSLYGRLSARRVR